MFTDWFALNERHPPARAQTYVEILQYYVWYERSKIWKPRKQRKCIGRIVYSTLASEIASLLLPAGRTSHCRHRSELWKHCKVFTLTRSMRVNEYYANGELDTRKQDFNQWVLAVGDGKLPSKMKDGEDEPTWIQILEKFLINALNSPIAQIVAKTYPNFIERHKEDAYLRERAILTPRNDDANAINAYILDKLEGMPPHALTLKKELPINAIVILLFG
ncbi:ATP-dependent DNA helicase PIF1-like protein [Tanacetum coccineum]